MKFSEFFNGNNDRDIAAQIKATTNISMDNASREKTRGFLFEYAHMRPIRARSTPRPSRGTFTSFLTAHIHPVPVIAAMLIVAVSGSTVGAAEGSLPGDVLYPVKVHVTEEVRAALATSPKARADWAVERAERRLEEAAMLSLAGKLDDVTRAEIDTNLEEHVRHATSDQAQLEAENERSDASEIEKNIGAVRIARANILDSEKRSLRTVATARAKTATDTATMSMQMAAPAQGEQGMSDDESETLTRGQRTAAKARIEATKKFLKARSSLSDQARKQAEERLKAATEAFSSGDEDSARGNKEDASSNFNAALEAATEIETFISDSNDPNNEEDRHDPQDKNSDTQESGKSDEDGGRDSSGPDN